MHGDAKMKIRVFVFYPLGQTTASIGVKSGNWKPVHPAKVWWRSVYARRHEIKNKRVFLFVMLVSKTCRDVQQFNEV